MVDGDGEGEQGLYCCLRGRVLVLWLEDWELGGSTV